MSSLENISAEAIQCLAFADSYTKKAGMCLSSSSSDRGSVTINRQDFQYLIFRQILVHIPLSGLVPVWGQC